MFAVPMAWGPVRVEETLGQPGLQSNLENEVCHSEHNWGQCHLAHTRLRWPDTILGYRVSCHWALHVAPGGGKTKEPQWLLSRSRGKTRHVTCGRRSLCQQHCSGREWKLTG